MKYLLVLLSFAALCSCNLTKKATTKTQTNADSTGTKSSSLVDVKKKDTAGAIVTTTTNKKVSNSGYDKTTTVEEYFSDEFGFDAKDPKKATAKDTGSQKSIVTHSGAENPAGKLLYRKTTIQEKGVVKTTENDSTAQTQTANAKSVDSSNHANMQTATVTNTQVKEKDSKLNLSIFPWWLWLIIVAAIAAAIYFKVNPLSWFLRK